jgi:hypothetical protein
MRSTASLAAGMAEISAAIRVAALRRPALLSPRAAASATVSGSSDFMVG